MLQANKSILEANSGFCKSLKCKSLFRQNDWFITGTPAIAEHMQPSRRMKVQTAHADICGRSLVR